MPHTSPILIPQGENTFIQLSLEKPDRLVIFVHGFGGGSTSTWNEFPELIKANKDFDKADVFFFGYESLKQQVNNNAVAFYGFLKEAAAGLASKFDFAGRDKQQPVEYNNIVIVAHSLGAILVRRALIMAKRNNDSWLNRSKMVLFAPAHMGSRVQQGIENASGFLGRMLALIGLIKVPALDDLRPNSVTITKLKEDTAEFLGKNDGNFAIAARVIWAENEKIVFNDFFGNDPAPDLRENQSHTSVCKPSAKNLFPYEVVKSVL